MQSEVSIMNEKLVPLVPKRLRQFYEPLVLCKSLSDLSNGRPLHNNDPTIDLAPPDKPQTPEARFHRFVYKLAHVCSSQRRGETITALSIIEREGDPVYMFCCNNLAETKLQEVQEYISTILRTIASDEAGSGTGRRRCHVALQQVLVWTRPRIEVYLRGISENVEKCIDLCQGPNGGEDGVVLKGLESLLSCCSEQSLPKLSQDQYIATSVAVLYCAQVMLHDVRVRDILNRRAESGRLAGGASHEAWAELRHCLSRLLSYEQAVSGFIEARREWPELFENSSVEHVPSSSVWSNPLHKKSKSAANIVGRMTSEKGRMADLRSFTDNLQGFDLDERIQEQCRSGTFRPVVHAEVLLLDFLTTQSQSVSFFNGWAYIGSSKPTCRLCQYYFQAHPSRIKSRPSHGNLYLCWRFPDAYGKVQSDRRQKMFNSLIERIRDDAFKVMSDKQPLGKKHDSMTYDTFSTWPTDVSGPVEVIKDGVASLSEMLALQMRL